MSAAIAAAVAEVAFEHGLAAHLRADDRVLTTLEVDDAVEPPMTGERVRSCRWSFKRSGLLRISDRASAERDNTYTATLKKDRADQHAVPLPDGESLTWRQTETQGRKEWLLWTQVEHA